MVGFERADVMRHSKNNINTLLVSKVVGCILETGVVVLVSLVTDSVITLVVVTDLPTSESRASQVDMAWWDSI